MDQNTQQIIDDVVGKTKAALLEFKKKGSDKYQEAVKIYGEDLKERLPLYFQNLAEGGGNPEATKFFLQMIAEEKNILESILLSFQMIAASVMKEAINRIRDIIITSLMSVLSKV